MRKERSIKNALVVATLAALAMALGCRNCGSVAEPSASTSPATTKPDKPVTRPVFGLPPGWELVPNATYAARQSGGEVKITAKGQHNTGGYQTMLVQSPLRIWPPQWMMAHKPPDGIVTQAITPYQATASFKTTDPIAAVQVTDAAGRHEVTVEQGE